jgi:hypothetical protein
LSFEFFDLAHFEGGFRMERGVLLLEIVLVGVFEGTDLGLEICDDVF